jgi:hypothetical protein
VRDVLEMVLDLMSGDFVGVTATRRARAPGEVVQTNLDPFEVEGHRADVKGP